MLILFHEFIYLSSYFWKEEVICVKGSSTSVVITLKNLFFFFLTETLYMAHSPPSPLTKIIAEDVDLTGPPLKRTD